MKSKEMLKAIKGARDQYGRPLRTNVAQAFHETLDELDTETIREEEELEWERRDARMQRKTARKAKQERRAQRKPEDES